jgi:hypothetical protein
MKYSQMLLPTQNNILLINMLPATGYSIHNKTFASCL